MVCGCSVNDGLGRLAGSLPSAVHRGLEPVTSLNTLLLTSWSSIQDGLTFEGLGPLGLLFGAPCFLLLGAGQGHLFPSKSSGCNVCVVWP